MIIINEEEIGCLIMKLRQSRHLSQEEMGNLLHVSSRTVRNWEKGVSLPTMKDIAAICNEFNISLEEVFEGKLNLEKELKREINVVRQDYDFIAEKLLRSEEKINSISGKLADRKMSSKLINSIAEILFCHVICCTVTYISFIYLGEYNLVSFVMALIYLGLMTRMIMTNRDSRESLLAMMIYFAVLIISLLGNYYAYSRTTITLVFNPQLNIINGGLLGIGYLAPYDKHFILFSLLCLYATLLSGCLVQIRRTGYKLYGKEVSG